jgi:hypothetical protein
MRRCARLALTYFGLFAYPPMTRLYKKSPEGLFRVYTKSPLRDFFLFFLAIFIGFFTSICLLLAFFLLFEALRLFIGFFSLLFRVLRLLLAFSLLFKVLRLFFFL